MNFTIGQLQCKLAPHWSTYCMMLFFWCHFTLSHNLFLVMHGLIVNKYKKNEWNFEKMKKPNLSF